MDFRGVYQNGVIKPTEPVSLPEGTVVSCHPADTVATGMAREFWSHESVDTLAARQGVQAIDRIESLRGDWPADESVDDLLASIRASRA